MGRAEDRKTKKNIQRKIGKQGLEKLMDDTNQQYIKQEVNRQCKYFEEVWMESTAEALIKNGISTTKAKIIARDIENSVVRRCSKK